MTLGLVQPEASSCASSTQALTKLVSEQLKWIGTLLLSLRTVISTGQRRSGSSGNSLMEMVVVLAILSLLATMATPYATKSFRREKEIQLRETLRTVRRAIDQFHADMEAVPADKKGASSSSANGYPLSLQVLVDGIEKSGENGERQRKRYLRSLPVNPFAAPGAPLATQWTFVSFQSEKTVIATSSYGTTLAEAQQTTKDIYDLHSRTPGIALDGTRYADW